MARIRFKQVILLKCEKSSLKEFLRKRRTMAKQSWRLRSEAVLMDSTLSENQKADSLEAFLNKYPSEEAITIRYHMLSS